MNALPPKAESVLRAHGNVIDAIKIVREVEGLGLKEAKDRVDAWLASQPELKAQLQARGKEARAGFLILAVVFAAGCAAAAWFLTR